MVSLDLVKAQEKANKKLKTQQKTVADEQSRNKEDQRHLKNKSLTNNVWEKFGLSPGDKVLPGHVQCLTGAM